MKPSDIAMTTVATLLAATGAIGQDWKAQPIEIPTRWSAQVSPSNALPDYPRPQLVRPKWQNLNGLWEYAIISRSAAKPTRYAAHILVPYPLESSLSGVAKTLKPTQRLWYRRTFQASEAHSGQRTLLHFGAVDYEASVYLNGRDVGSHTGGYQAFTIDISRAMRPGKNEIIVKVYDATQAGPGPHGKQGMPYTPSSGIWQTVWLETVPQTYIESLRMTPDVAHSKLYLEARTDGDTQGYAIEAIVRDGSDVVTRKSLQGETALTLDHPRLWSPSDPFLYDLDVRLLRDGQVVDEVTSYFGMRKVEISKDPMGHNRIFLNDRYIYNLGILDQGFWPDGIYTAPTDTALKFDIETLKSMGFNTIRKHIKIEPERWYYYCDKLGMLVWQDMVNPSNNTPAARAEFETEAKADIGQLYNHPSIITWVLFNEGWGAYDQPRIAAWMRTLDSSRLLNAHSGPYDQARAEKWVKALAPADRAKWDKGDAEGELLQRFQHDNRVMEWPGSDMTDVHMYPGPEIPPAESGKVRVLGEFGGLGVIVKGHLWQATKPGEGYRDVQLDAFPKEYGALLVGIKDLESQGLAGSIYTQITDVEQEQNGLMTYDRGLIKIPINEIAAMNAQLVRPH
jgi:Glycosyl hydrolases family 2, sugar binding domain/Glycosyl hydrolases family 2/Glycosyl hydrolases family 2, TIM barrel domain